MPAPKFPRKIGTVIASGNSPQWYLRKYIDKEIFGPVSFEQIKEWASSAQIHPQDSISNDGRTWNKAPMLEDLQMDWIVEASGQPLYGPTTASALLEFYTLGEITPETRILNCCTGETMALGEAEFFLQRVQTAEQQEILQSRIEELEMMLLQKQTELGFALDEIARLEQRVRDLET